MFNNYRHSLFESYKNLAEKVMPTLKDSNFSKTGMLTPEEFVQAGDFLVENYPNWQWYSFQSGKKKLMNFLPKDKQMLINNSIRCNKNQNIILEQNEYGVYDVTIKNDQSYNDDSRQSCNDDNRQSDNDDFDLADFEIDDFAGSDPASIKNDDKPVDKTNKYNISITYDNYFRTPRMWMVGFNHHGVPLSHEKMLKDISIEHSKITVTIEEHPFYNDLHYISVHPCKHGHVMKKD